MISDGLGMAPYLWYKEKGLFNAKTRSEIECYVCPKCGCIELKAENPSVFHI